MDDVTDRLRPVALVLALIGTGIAGYLTYVHYAGIQPVCAVAHGCEKVQTSDWSKLAGVPVALLGLLTYVLIVVSLLSGARRRRSPPRRVADRLRLQRLPDLPRALHDRRDLHRCVASAIVMTLLAVVTTVRLLRVPDPALTAH